MALYPNSSPIRPNQQNQAGDINALAIERFTGLVEGTIARKSALSGFVKTETVKGTNMITNKGVGKATLQKVTPGTAPDGTGLDISKTSVVVDTLILARNQVPLLEGEQIDFSVEKAIAEEQGKEHAKFQDQAFFIQAAKTSLLTQSAYSGGTSGKPAGHSGGNQQVLAAAADRQDPAKLYEAIKNLFVKFELKDVDPRMDNVLLAMGPEDFYTLQQTEYIVNGEYITSEGNKLSGVPIFKAYGVPVISSNNVPKTNVTGHFLSNAANSNAYDGDFSKLVAVAFSPRALLAGASIGLSAKKWWDDAFLQTTIDSYTAFGIGPNRAEFAGSIWLP